MSKSTSGILDPLTAYSAFHMSKSRTSDWLYDLLEVCFVKCREWSARFRCSFGRLLRTGCDFICLPTCWRLRPECEEASTFATTTHWIKIVEKRISLSKTKKLEDWMMNSQQRSQQERRGTGRRIDNFLRVQASHELSYKRSRLDEGKSWSWPNPSPILHAQFHSRAVLPGGHVEKLSEACRCNQ